MKSIIVTIATVAATATALLAAPAVSYAQSSHSTLTRAQVRQELFDLESVGYEPIAGDGDNYPGDIVAAQERLPPSGWPSARAPKQPTDRTVRPARIRARRRLRW